MNMTSVGVSLQSGQPFAPPSMAAALGRVIMYGAAVGTYELDAPIVALQRLQSDDELNSARPSSRHSMVTLASLHVGADQRQFTALALCEMGYPPEIIDTASNQLQTIDFGLLLPYLDQAVEDYIRALPVAPLEEGESAPDLSFDAEQMKLPWTREPLAPTKEAQ